MLQQELHGDAQPAESAQCARRVRRVLRGVAGRPWAPNRVQSDGRLRPEAIQGGPIGLHRGAGARRYQSKAHQGAKRVVRQEKDPGQAHGPRAGQTVQEEAQVGA